MALNEDGGQGGEMQRKRDSLYSPGHDPPRYVDRSIPTLEARIYADGGPGKVFPGAQGTNPWVLGSMTIGSGKIWSVDMAHFETSTPNVYYKLRHNHPGTAAPSATSPYNFSGGTIESWHLAARGGRELLGRPDAPLLAVRSGTVFLYGFGAGSVSGTSSNRVHRAIGIQGVDRFSAKVKGQII